MALLVWFLLGINLTFSTVLFHTKMYRKDAHNPQEVKKFVAYGLEKLVSITTDKFKIAQHNI